MGGNGCEVRAGLPKLRPSGSVVLYLFDIVDRIGGPRRIGGDEGGVGPGVERRWPGRWVAKVLIPFQVAGYLDKL